MLSNKLWAKLVFQKLFCVWLFVLKKVDKADTGMASGECYKVQKWERLLNTEASSVCTSPFEYMNPLRNTNVAKNGILLRNINVAKSVIFPCFGVF